MRVILHRHVQLDEITATISKISTLESARAQEMLTDFGIASLRSSRKNRSAVDEWALIRTNQSQSPDGSLRHGRKGFYAGGRK